MSKKYTLPFLLMSSLCAILFFFTKKENPSISNDNHLDAKHEPSEQFFLQRAYPDGKFNFDNYQTALRKAKTIATQQTGKNGLHTAWTVQGPGNIGARINTIAVHPEDETIIYAGFSQGGVWKTVDNGDNWVPIFDDQIFSAIGDIAIDTNDPDIIYVGTGDANISGYPFIGDGLYKSEDGGTTWTNIGLEAQRIISKILIDPTDSNTIYVATMGLPFEQNAARGLYKTTDGGATWEQILFVGVDAGIIDIAMQADNPQIIYAASWNRIRNNYESSVFGHAARVRKSTDGGATWTMLLNGLPQKKMGRIGLAVSQNAPETVFAIYADTMSNLHHIYKSDNGGMLWDTLNTTEEAGMDVNALGGFAWYFGQIRVNPYDHNDIFMLGVDLWRSLDGGQSWFAATPPWWEYSVHADKHDLIFTENENILLATDGGLYRSNIFTNEWVDVENIPTTQFYRVAYNPHIPDRYYGGTQDNGTTGGNTENINEWDRIFGGDGFQALFHPDDPTIMFASYQRGRIHYSKNMGSSWQDATDGIDEEDNRNWDMPYIMSPHNPDILYAGTDKIYRSQTGEVPFWEPISDNLTDVDTSDSRYHNITTLDESTLVQQLLYVGTGDGNLWRTDNDGVHWEPITNDLPNQYFTSIHASPNIENTVFVSQSGYRDNDNAAKIWRSDDRGDSWLAISGDLPDLAINDIWVYPNYQDSIIFVATDGGVYLTQNAGENWNRLGTEMPFVPVYDIVWNEVRNEVVAGTFARSIMSFPLDSLGIYSDVMIAVNEPTAALPIENLTIFPNPARDFINIEFSNTEPNKSADIVIIDAQGKLVFRTENSQQGKVQERINIQDLAAGNYFVKIKIRHAVRTGQFVVLD